MPKTKVNSKQLYQRRNTSDVFTRLIIMGVLRTLNTKLSYEQIWEDTEEGIEKIVVPFFFDFTGGSITSERFIQDNYLNWTDDECTYMGIKKMDGDYKPIPYGVVQLSSTSIDSGNISNRFVMGQYQKKVNDHYESFVSFLYSIPLSFSFNVTIVCDTMNTAWKIEQAFREYFYKNKTFRVNYKGSIVPARIGFPESIGSEKTNTYTTGQQNEAFNVKLSFDLACETYQPVFDPHNERSAENTIKNFGIHITLDGKKEKNNIISKTPLDNKVFSALDEIVLEWKYNYDVSDLVTVDILYDDVDTGEEVLIETVENNNFYYWQIPGDLSLNENAIDITILNTEDCQVVTQPKIQLYPSPDTNIVSEENVVILNKGFFIAKTNNINAIASYINKSGKVIEKKIIINLLNNMVDINNPLTFKPFIYNNKVKEKHIRLKIRDSLNRERTTYFLNDTTSYITII